jgi:hypothetical protein
VELFCNVNVSLANALEANPNPITVIPVTTNIASRT